MLFLKKPSANTYQEAHSAFKTRYPKVQFAWSYKTNYLNAVCNIFHQEGSWAEVVSGFEFEKALETVCREAKLFSTVPKNRKKIWNVPLNIGSLIHIDHFDELYLLILKPKTNKKARVAIRVNMDTGIYPIWDRFGFNYENGEAWNAINRIMLKLKTLN